MSFSAVGTSVVQNTGDGGKAGVALTFDPDMARRIAEALNKYLPGQGLRGVTDPLTGKQVDHLDMHERTPLSEVVGKGQYVKIVGPYATATMDTPGGREVRSLAEGAIVPGDVSAGHARHLIDVGLAVLVEAASAQEAHDGTPPPASTDQAANNNDQAPAGNASREVWATYAASKGAPQDETKPVDEGGLSRDDLRAKYGA